MKVTRSQSIRQSSQAGKVKKVNDGRRIETSSADKSVDEIQFMVHNMCESAFSNREPFSINDHERCKQNKSRNRDQADISQPPNRSEQYMCNRPPNSEQYMCNQLQQEVGKRFDHRKRSLVQNTLDENFAVKFEEQPNSSYPKSISRKIHDCLNSSIQFAMIAADFKENINGLQQLSRELSKGHESATDYDEDGFTRKVTSLTCEDIAKKSNTHLNGAIATLQRDIHSALQRVQKIIDEEIVEIDNDT